MMIDASRTGYSFQPAAVAEAATVIKYRGHFTQEVITSILGKTSIRLQCDGEDLRTRRRVLRVMVELLQNIVRHREPRIGNTDAVPADVFALRKQPGQYIIVAGNPVAGSAAPDLAARLEGVNSLNCRELKHLYRRLLATARLSARGGGLGFVDIARRSGTGLRFDFHEISDEHCFFRLTVALGRRAGSGTKKNIWTF